MCAFVQGYNNGAGHSLSPNASLEETLIFFQGEESKAMGDWRLACREVKTLFYLLIITKACTCRLLVIA